MEKKKNVQSGYTWGKNRIEKKVSNPDSLLYPPKMNDEARDTTSYNYYDIFEVDENDTARVASRYAMKEHLKALNRVKNDTLKKRKK